MILPNSVLNLWGRKLKNLLIGHRSITMKCLWLKPNLISLEDPRSKDRGYYK
jgi:hypothetical protein